MSDKVFRHTPHRAANAMKIIVGNKTNSITRELEETEEDIEELTGVITSIDKDKMTGDGWKVKADDGNTYNCNCAFNMYELPETEEYGGVYYPTEKVTVKFTKNPVLKTNTITEITSLGKNESKIDLSKWKHGNKETTVIAKPKSAISVSNSMISFNYDNANEVTADEDSIKTKGKKTKIETDTFDINSNNVNIGEESLDDYINRLNDKKNEERYEIIETKAEYGINIQKTDNIGQLNINTQKDFKINPTPSSSIADDERIITDLKNPIFFPGSKQKRPLITGSNINELYLYPNGLVTVKTQNSLNDKINQTITWITTEYVKKNVLDVVVKEMCDCCDTTSVGKKTYFNYCPHCKMWNVLYESGNVIKCESCSNTWCQGCGQLKNVDCSIKEKNLKKYNSEWTISAIGTNCDYCDGDIPSGKLREYANYCPKCHKWGYLRLETKDYKDTERHFFHCDSCEEDYCVNCSISQGKSFIKSFLNDNVYYENFINNYRKITHIRDD